MLFFWMLYGSKIYSVVNNISKYDHPALNSTIVYEVNINRVSFFGALHGVFRTWRVHMLLNFVSFDYEWVYCYPDSIGILLTLCVETLESHMALFFI